MTDAGWPQHGFVGGTIHTENSCKYSIGQFHALAATADFVPLRTWADSAGLFSVHYLTVKQLARVHPPGQPQGLKRAG